MSLLKPKLLYRIGVRFDPPLSTLAQLREVVRTAVTRNTVIVGLTPYDAKIIAVFPTQQSVEPINYGYHWFSVGGSRAIIDTLRPEVNITS